MKSIKVAAAMIVRNDGAFRVFAAARGYGEQKGQWEFPGGKLENGETAPQALKREIREELTAVIRVEEKLCRVEYDYPAFHLDMECFLCSIESGELRLLEAEDARWLSEDELFSVPWLPADRIAAEKLKAYLNRNKEKETMDTILIRNGMVYDAVHDKPEKQDILVKDGKIAAMGTIPQTGDVRVIDAEGLRVYPGLVEAHGHIGLDGWAMGYEGQDYNEYNDPVTPQLRALDGVNPFDLSIREAALGGVTTLCVGPGSSNVLGGTFTVIKSTGTCVDDMAVIPEAAMKCAFGENPKRCYREKGISSRMTNAAKLREMLFKAREYMRKLDAAGEDESKKPAFDMKLNALLPVMRGQMPLKAHAHQANDIMTAVRIAREFSVKLTLEHVTDGALIIDELKKADVPLAVGPTFGQPGKIELKNKSWETPVRLNEAGLQVSIITDSPVTEQGHLRFCAAMAMADGMKESDALRCITINPARHIGAQDRVGSLEVGKDADILLTDGDLFELSTAVVTVMINGRIISRERE